MEPTTSTSTTPQATARDARPLGPRTVGEMVLTAARRHSGVALQHNRSGASVYISYPELGTISTETPAG